MPFKGSDFQSTRDEAYSNLTHGLYDQEYADQMDGLVDLENGVRKYWADKLREYGQSNLTVAEAQAVIRIAALLDPYNDANGPHGEFARTSYDADGGLTP